MEWLDGWEERGKQREGGEVFKRWSRTDGRSSELLRVEVGQGEEQSSTTATLTHTNTSLRHFWTRPAPSSVDSTAAGNSTPPITLLLTCTCSAPASVVYPPTEGQIYGHGAGLSRRHPGLRPAHPGTGQQRHGFRGCAGQLLPTFQPLLLPVYPPRGAGGSWACRCRR